jgi:hypothetical protein
MTEASILPAQKELERAFLALAFLFKREMPKPVITIQTRGRRRMKGWYAHHRWQNDQLEPLSELNVCAEDLACPIEEIAEVLLHEMCHRANALDGIDDCSKNQYHNKHFKTRCEAIGLQCEKMGHYGWAQTSLTPELAAQVATVHIAPAAFSLFRLSREQAKAPIKMKKWSCGCTNIRAAKEVDATCNRCGQRFCRQE